MVTLSHPRRALLTASAVLAALALAACSGDTGLADPAPTGRTAQQCAALHAALPAKLMGLSASATTPKSVNTAAWGSPAITLRCGVPTPGVLDPTSHAYDPSYGNHDVAELSGVCWSIEKLNQQGTSLRFTTVKQQAYVELVFPAHYAGKQAPVNELAGAILKTDPADPAHGFDCL